MWPRFKQQTELQHPSGLLDGVHTPSYRDRYSLASSRYEFRSREARGSELMRVISHLVAQHGSRPFSIIPTA